MMEMTVEQALEYVQLDQAIRYLNEECRFSIMTRTQQIRDTAHTTLFEQREHLIKEIKGS